VRWLYYPCAIDEKFCSEAIRTLQSLVLNRALAVLVDEIQEPRWHGQALKLVHPLLRTHISIINDRRPCDRALKLCCCLLGDDSDTLGDDQFRSELVITLIRHFSGYAFRFPEPFPHTQLQFDQLVDYLLRTCEGTDDFAISDTFYVLAWLGGSPSTRDRTRRYIDTIIRFMGQETTCYAALFAACAVGGLVASMGQEDESLREHFSKVLASAVLSNAPQRSTHDNPFTDMSFFDSLSVIIYLRLLCALSKEHTWHPQLHHSGHFNNCVAIAKTLSSQEHDGFDEYAVPVVQIIAIMDASVDEHPLVTDDQAYAIWPFILRAWRYIFDLRFFGGAGPARWWQLSVMDYIDALPSLVEYARKRQSQSDENDRLLALVETACRKLDEDKPQYEHDGAQRIRDDPFWRQILPDLRKQIHELLDASQRNV
jgi:hypothetical protein